MQVRNSPIWPTSIWLQLKTPAQQTKFTKFSSEGWTWLRCFLSGLLAPFSTARSLPWGCWCSDPGPDGLSSPLKTSSYRWCAASPNLLFIPSSPLLLLPLPQRSALSADLLLSDCGPCSPPFQSLITLCSLLFLPAGEPLSCQSHTN